MKDYLGMKEKAFLDLYDETYFPKLAYRSIRKDYANKENENASVCEECGGKCCKSCGCRFSPDDFKDISYETLKNKIQKGYISIVLIDSRITEKERDVYILRTRNQGAPILDTCYGKGAPCVLLTENGCKLDYKNRPTEGKLLIPKNSERGCYSKYSIQECCYEWEPHLKVLHQLAQDFYDKEIPYLE